MSVEKPSFNPDLQKQLELDKYSDMFRKQVMLLSNKNGIEEYLEINNLQIVNVDIIENSGKILAVSNKFIINTPPLKHEYLGSRKSDSEYHIDGYEEDSYVIYISQLGPNSSTSLHRHPFPVKEFYFVLHGESFQNGKKMDEISVINPGEYHQVRTGNSSVLLGILMENAALIPKDLRHIQ